MAIVMSCIKNATNCLTLNLTRDFLKKDRTHNFKLSNDTHFELMGVAGYCKDLILGDTELLD